MPAAVCFVDLSGFTALTEAHGDHAAADLAERFAEIAQQAAGEHGRVVKMIGDAVLVLCATPAGAVDFIQHLWSSVQREPGFPDVRAGLHHGEVVERSGDVYGATVNVAARIAAAAAGGQVLGTAAIAGAARAAGVGVRSLGPIELRNVRDPIEVFELEVGDEHPLEVIDPVCRMRVHTSTAAGQLKSDGRDYWFCSLECAARFAAAPASYVRTA